MTLTSQNLGVETPTAHRIDAYDFKHLVIYAFAGNVQYNTIQYNIHLMKKIPADTAATEITK